MRGLAVALVVVAVTACGNDDPAFISVLPPTDTSDTLGPYRIEAHVVAPNGVYRLLVRLRQEPLSDVFADLRFRPLEELHDGGVYVAELAGRPAGTVFEYYLLLIDGEGKGGGALVTYPPAAPEELLTFTILATP
jgi:hypothetical protein